MVEDDLPGGVVERLRAGRGAELAVPLRAAPAERLPGGVGRQHPVTLLEHQAPLLLDQLVVAPGVPVDLQVGALGHALRVAHRRSAPRGRRHCRRRRRREAGRHPGRLPRPARLPCWRRRPSRRGRPGGRTARAAGCPACCSSTARCRSRTARPARRPGRRRPRGHRDGCRCRGPAIWVDTVMAERPASATIAASSASFLAFRTAQPSPARASRPAPVRIQRCRGCRSEPAARWRARPTPHRRSPFPSPPGSRTAGRAGPRARTAGSAGSPPPPARRTRGARSPTATAVAVMPHTRG